MKSKKRLGIWKKMLFALVPILVFLLILELGARVVCAGRFAQYNTSIAIQGNSRWDKDILTAWKNREGYLEYDDSSQYNEYGMRVKPGEFKMPPKEKNDFWVFLFGGSAIAGMGSNQDGQWLKITGVPTHSIENSIDGQLEKILKKSMPGRNVRVFNAAVSAGNIIQSRMNYEKLKYLNPDWIVSMDGVNDLHSLKEGENPYKILFDSWDAHPIYKFPYRQCRWLMRNSALAFLVGEYVFFKSGIIRNAKNVKQDSNVLGYWLNQDKAKKAAVSNANADNLRAVASFMRELEKFNNILKYDGQNYLLLVQPHLSMRNPEKLKDVELAVYHYRLSTNSMVDPFMPSIHGETIKNYAENKNVVSMNAMHSWDGWIFVDYCHFSEQANKRIAEEIASFILSGGKQDIFKETKAGKQ
ncbi:MAG: hypothetical protein A2020_10865 [Lentisphaerae bacterium GWF2_45_14]|nr:MAG: hypothetical protein A2020_10865 [Lentisphaerae bacterium GWF2_45_14]